MNTNERYEETLMFAAYTKPYATRPTHVIKNYILSPDTYLTQLDERNLAQSA